ncbi:MAG: RsmB/NOP family class I SAM-dependent RNA methyltransferase [Bacteroidetes bacterium]|nr:RsmB/NOP family class I SAM-dependent RNA methyltransferase [Bacteroidota bacterium]
MKLHRSLVIAVKETLSQIFEGGIYADKAVEQVLKQNPKWGARDRRFIAETTYEMVRWWRLLNEILGTKKSSFDYNGLLGIHFILKDVELPAWDEFRELNKQQILEKAEQVKKIRKFRESYPDWMDDLLVNELGEESWEREACALNTEADVVLRVNTLKTKKELLQKMLLDQGVVTHAIAGYPDALKLEKRVNLNSVKEYQQGLFEVQDASSQLIAANLELEPGMFVIDACAGAGGKSLHIAAIMKNKGKVVSMDVEDRKLKELHRRADRAGVTIIETKPISISVITTLKEKADRILLDVPCSGLGVLRRTPDSKWKLNQDFIASIKHTQQTIISEYSQMLKPGGIMIYATCSILPSENQKQVELFLAKHADFKLLSDRKILPSEGYDGFYMAKLTRLSV